MLEQFTQLTHWQKGIAIFVIAIISGIGYTLGGKIVNNNKFLSGV